MNAQPFSSDRADAGQLARLSNALSAVERMAGQTAGDANFGPVEAAYAAASPIARHRYDRALQHAAAWAASGVEALIAVAQGGRPVEAAAARLADELRQAIGDAIGALGR